MLKMVKSLMCVGLLLPVLLSGCAVYQECEEAMYRADRALEQAELANQRVDQITGVAGGK